MPSDRNLHQDDPISSSDLAQYDGSDPSKPIYVAIKGRVFDVTHKKDMYGKGTGYNVFAGKDASKGLGERIDDGFACESYNTGMSSLDPKDAVPDFSGLNDAQRKTLDQWETFFEKVRCVVRVHRLCTSRCASRAFSRVALNSHQYSTSDCAN